MESKLIRTILVQSAKDRDSMDTSTNTPDRIVRIAELTARVGLSKSAIYDRLSPASPTSDPICPLPLQLGTGPRPPVGWLDAEIDAWIAAQAARRTLRAAASARAAA